MRGAIPADIPAITAFLRQRVEEATFPLSNQGQWVQDSQAVAWVKGLEVNPAIARAEAAGQGVTQAVLFTHSSAALRAYGALGFRQVGHYGLTLFATPQVVPHG